MRIEPGSPISVGAQLTTPMVWSRVDLSEQSFDEGWMQNLIFEHPTALPITEIDPGFAPLIPVGREVATSAGPIDALYVSPDGAITVVEAKLWRNPQARREVVGQIIDYATALAEWGYDDLDRACRVHADAGLWDLVAATSAATSETVFVDAVARNLRKGRFLLLVVGDGIREEVERMARYVQAAPQLQFTLALVELRVYDRPDDTERLIVPCVVARSEEIIRAVVDVDLAPEAKVSVDVSVPSEPTTPRRTGVLSTQQFFEELSTAVPSDLVQFAREFKTRFENDERYVVEMKASSYVIKLRDPGGGPPLSLLVVTRTGYVYPGWLGQQLPKAGLPPDHGHELVADIARITGMKVKVDDPQWLQANIPLAIVAGVSDHLALRLDRFADDIAELAETE